MMNFTNLNSESKFFFVKIYVRYKSREVPISRVQNKKTYDLT